MPGVSNKLNNILVTPDELEVLGVEE